MVILSLSLKTWMVEEKIRIPTGQGYKVLMDYIPQNQSFYDIDVIANPTSHIKFP